MTVEELRERVLAATRVYSPTLRITPEEYGGIVWLTFVSNDFAGLNLYERFERVLALLDRSCPEIFDSFYIRIECFESENHLHLADEAEALADRAEASQRIYQ